MKVMLHNKFALNILNCLIFYNALFKVLRIFPKLMEVTLRHKQLYINCNICCFNDTQNLNDKLCD